MAEPQKEASLSVNPKQKNSLLDLDFGKDDFLSSWKSMSITEDDTMDLDFGPVPKGKKTAFNFDTADMDFNLGGDFGKIPSFNLDIPDIDISSPAKKDGKPKGRSSEECASGNTKGKADRFEFSFDFGKLDDFNFNSSSKKDVEVNKGEEIEDFSKRRVSQISGGSLDEDIDTHECEKSRNLPAPGDLIASELDTQVGVGSSSDSLNEKYLSESTSRQPHINSTLAIDQSASQAIIMPEQTTSTSMKVLDSQPDKSISLEPLSKDVCIADETILAESVHTDLRNKPSGDTTSELQVEVGNTRHITSSMEDNGGSQVSTTIPAFVANKEGAEPALEESHVGKSLAADASREPVPGKQINLKDQGPLDLSTSPLNSRTTVSNLMPEKERETVTLSKYFKQPNKTESQIQNASHQTKLPSVHATVIGIRQPDESRNFNSIEAKSDGILAGSSLSSSGVLIRKEHSQIGTQEGSKCLKTNRPLGQDLIKQKLASKACDKNLKSLDSFRSLVRPSTLSGLANKSTSQNCANPESQAMNVETSQTRRDRAAEGPKVSSSNAIKQNPVLSSLTISRNSGANLDSSKSTSQKGFILSKDTQQHCVLAGSRPSKTATFVDTEKPSPPIPSLKRKIVEASTADLISKPSKRLSASPSTGNSAEASGNVFDKEVVDGKSMNKYETQQNSIKDVRRNMNELEVPFSVESDSIIENAEACTKGLEDICNILRKKHEEAKEILVRAVVNNNKLLMLNHPIYEEKIRMVQKFAMQLTLREIRTQT